MAFLRQVALVSVVSSGVAFAGGVVNPVHLDLPRVGYGLGLLRWLANLLALFTCLVMHLELLVYAVLNTQSQRMSRSDMDTLAANTAFPVASAVVFLALLLDTCFLACVACCDRRRRQALPEPTMGTEAPTTTPVNFWVLVIPLVSAYVAVGVLDHSRLAADGSESTVVGWAVGYMGISLVVFLVARLVLPLMARSWDRNGTSCWLLDTMRDATGGRHKNEPAKHTSTLESVLIGAFAAWPVALSFWVSLFLSAGFVDVDRLDDPATWRPLIVDMYTSALTALIVSTAWARNYVLDMPYRAIPSTIATAAAVAAAHTDAFPSYMHTARID